MRVLLEIVRRENYRDKTTVLFIIIITVRADTKCDYNNMTIDPLRRELYATSAFEASAPRPLGAARVIGLYDARRWFRIVPAGRSYRKLVPLRLR